MMKILVLLIMLQALVFGNIAYSKNLPKEVDELISKLSHKDKDVKKNTIRKLGNLGDPLALAALKDLWDKEMDEEVIFFIEVAMSKIKLLDPGQTARVTAAKELGRKAEASFAIDVKDTFFGKIVKMDNQERIDTLSLLEKSLAIEKEKKVKNAIVESIQKIKLSDEDKDVRMEAAGFFGSLGDPDTIMFLGRVLEKEKNEGVKDVLENAISKIEKKQQIAVVIQQLFNGVSVSSIYLLIAIGLAITFGVMGVINMAHGEFIMIGCYVAYVLQLCFKNYFPEGIFDLYFFISLPLSFIIAALLGWLLECSVIRLLYGRALDTLLATFGISLILQQFVRQIFGANNVDVTSPTWLNGGVSLMAGMLLPYKRLFIIGFTAAIVAGIYFLLLRTRQGLRIRAVMLNRNMSNCLGISVRKVDALTFALGSGLAGVAGCNISLLGSVGPSTGQNYIVDCFMVVVLGGVGKIVGAIAGAFGMGEMNSILEFFTTASMGKALVFLMIIVFLRFRPTGFAQTKGREEVRLETH